MKAALRTAFVAGLILFLSGCSCRELTKLDEAVFYEGPEFQLKLVRYWQNIPFSYNGEVFSVQCRSGATESLSAGKRQDPGWRLLGTGGAIGSTSAEQLANDLRADYIVVNDRILVKKNGGVVVSFDACATTRGWEPTSLPQELIDPIEKPDYCAPKGGADCRHYDFLDDRKPEIEAIRADSSGDVSFVVRAKAFKDGAVLHVASNDFGDTWDVTRLE